MLNNSTYQYYSFDIHDTSRPLTELHILPFALHQSLTDLQHGLTTIPLLEYILPEFRRHDILYSPNIVPFSPGRKLLADHTNIGPFLISRLVGHSVCCLFQGFVEVIRYQRGDDDETFRVVLFESVRDLLG
jgi:hypothetical protein